jgi:hypothetical protein
MALTLSAGDAILLGNEIMGWIGGAVTNIDAGAAKITTSDAIARNAPVDAVVLIAAGLVWKIGALDGDAPFANGTQVYRSARGALSYIVLGTFGAINVDAGATTNFAWLAPIGSGEGSTSPLAQNATILPASQLTAST